MVSSKLPASIRRALGRVDRRLGRVRAAAGLGLFVLIGSILATIGMAIDLARPIPLSTRWLIWGAWVALLAVLFVWRIAGPLLIRRPCVSDLAALAERGTPQLGDRLSATVELLNDRRPHGSPALIEALANQTGTEVEQFDARRSVSSGRAWRRVALGGTAAVLVAAPAVLRPDPFADLARRFFAPWSGTPAVTPFVVSVRPGNAWLTQGDDLAVAASIKPRFAWLKAVPSEAWVEWSGSQGKRSRRVPMERAVDGLFTATLEDVDESGVYRIASRSARSGQYRATVLHPPAVRALRARVTPPPYTGLADAAADDPAWIVAWQDSRITLELEADRTLVEAAVDWPIESSAAAGEPGAIATHSSNPVAMTRADARGMRWSATLPATATGPYTLALKSKEGVGSREEAPRRVEVRVDAPPAVAMTRAEAGDSDAPRPTSPGETLRLGVVASDDFAVAAAELHATIHRANASGTAPETSIQALTLAGLGAAEARGLAELDLAPLALGPGDVVTYRVRVIDNLPAPRGPHEAWSEDRDLGIVAGDDQRLAARDDEARAGLQEQLDQLKKDAADERKATEQLRYAADAARRGNGKWDAAQEGALDAREAAARDLGDRLQLFADEAAMRADFAPLAEPSRRIADLEAEAARQALDRARRADDPSRRLAELKQADAAQAAVQNRLEELQRQFDAQSQVAEDRRALGDLAERQARLADHAEALAEAADEGRADRARADQIQAEQEQVRRDLDELLQKSPTLKAEMLVDQVKRADALSEQIRALADRQTERSRLLADPVQLDPVLRALAAEQDELEADTRRLALRVDPTLDESGLARVNTEAARRPTEPLRRGDVESARQRMEESERELARLALDLGGLNNDPKSIARRLAKRQQEERDQVAEALGEDRHKGEVSSAEAKALAERLAPLIARQQSIATIAASLPDRAPEGQRETARQAADRAAEAARQLEDPGRPNQIDGPIGQAHDLLHRLADELPDANRRRGEARNRLDVARQRAEQVARDAENALRETLPQPGRSSDAVDELAARLKALAPRQLEVADLLSGLPVEPDQLDRRDRAAARARRLGEALDAGRRGPIAANLADARAAIDRLRRGIDGEAPADERADAIAAELRTAGPDDRARLAAALRALDTPDASLVRDEALRTMAMGGAEGARSASVALADALNDRLTDGGRAALLARLQRGVNRIAVPDDAADAQRRIADDLARLDAPAESLDPAIEAVGRAVALGDRAASLSTDPNQPAAPSPEALAAARAAAAGALERLSNAAPKPVPSKPIETAPLAPVPADPELAIDAEQVAESRDLRLRQRRISEGLQAALADQIPPQAALRGDARSLAGEVAELRRQMGELSPGGRGPADQVADLLGRQAPRSMAEAVGHLAGPRLNEARDAQRRSADALERAAREAARMARSVRSDLAAADPTGAAQQRAGESSRERAQDGGNEPEASELAQAREELEASRKLLAQARESGAGSSPEAARAMRRAAEDLHAAAEPPPEAQGALLAELGASRPTAEPADLEAPGDPNDASPGNPERASHDPKDGPAGRAEADLSRLQAAVRAQTGRSWGELPGHLRSEILQMAQGRYRDDYARLIRLYFREIAAAGTTKPADRPTP